MWLVYYVSEDGGRKVYGTSATREAARSFIKENPIVHEVFVNGQHLTESVSEVVALSYLKFNTTAVYTQKLRYDNFEIPNHDTL